MTKSFILLSAIALYSVSIIQGQTQKPELTGTLRGIVVRQDTSEPISGVRISIGKGNSSATMLLSNAQTERNKNSDNNEAVILFLQMDANSLANTDTGREFNTVTDKDGRFSFEGIPTGEYPVGAERDGYVSVDIAIDNMKTTSVAAGKTSEIVLKFIPAAAVSGRIVDSNGKAVPNATVEILRRKVSDGTSATETFTQRLSDDLGGYR